ncbi:MAG: hypothetical protein N2Z70_02890 [Bdellovibrionaceae bacterium]|jgi:hypothetical protein|nr:hypothetical protein [Pseudobdellovibrionaceae bacterium]
MRIPVLLILIILASSCIALKTQTRSENVVESSRSVNFGNRISRDEETELKLLENALQGREELLQYGRASPYFANLQERLEFLRQPNYRKRQEWLKQKQFWSRVSDKQKQFAPLIQQKDLAIGMTSEQVKESWGQPTEVSVSGAPQLGNMVWIYRTQVATQQGFQDIKKYVYFEGGVVTGWDTQSF